jgi:murein DD-endopeptidase MepM/ murein hydrolase activator NlpD
VFSLVAGYFLYRRFGHSSLRSARLMVWLKDPSSHLDWAVEAGERCDQAPFILPTSGYIGFLWDDSFRVGHRHQGIDIFGGGDPGVTPIVAAYAGYLTRLPDWKSSVIIRIPDDPLNPGRQKIWTYYTHMADQQGTSSIVSQFPPGTAEVFVEAGTLLGYQGNYSGDPNNPVGVHLHFSIVLSESDGKFRNELDFRNTLDPSLYFHLPLNSAQNPTGPPVCSGKNLP